MRFRRMIAGLCLGFGIAAASVCVGGPAVSEGESAQHSDPMLNGAVDAAELAEALNGTNLQWVGSTTWYVQTTNTYDGFAAAAAGPLMEGAQADVLRAYVKGPGLLTFWYQMRDRGLISFAIDGQVMSQSPLSGWWNSRQYEIPDGIHVLAWRGTNQWPASYNGGMVFLDQVTFVPGPRVPVLGVQPASRTNSAGSTVTFNVSATGTPSMMYQWFFEGTEIPGASSSKLELPNIQQKNAGSYYAVVSNAYGSAASSNALFTVLPALPNFTTNSAGQHVLIGSSATLSGTAIGTAPITYQWLFEDTPLVDQTNSSITISNVQYQHGGKYELQAANEHGSTIGVSALLIPYSLEELGAVLDCPSMIWSIANVPWFPQAETTSDGISAAQTGPVKDSQESVLRGTANGPATVTYSWKVNCNSASTKLAFALNGTVINDISGNIDWKRATNYIGAGQQVLDWKLYPYRGVNARGTGWVDQVKISPGITAPAIASQPRAVTNSSGNTVALSVGAIGTPRLRYAWQLDGAPIPGATNSSVSIGNAQIEDSGIYDVVVSSDYGSVTSASVVVVVNPASPVISYQPVDVSTFPGGAASFRVAARGSEPYSYQWLHDGLEIPGQTDSTLILSGVQEPDAGEYSAIVRNDFGAVTSAVARLEVASTPVVDYWRHPSSHPPTATGLGKLTAIAAGLGHTAALREDGTVVAWGESAFCTNVPSGLRDVIEIAAGSYHTVALKSDGTVVIWGDPQYGALFVPDDLTNVVQIAAAADYTLALKSDGTVQGWGQNDDGVLEMSAGLTNVQAITAGPRNAYAIHKDGSFTFLGHLNAWTPPTSLADENGNRDVLDIGVAGFSVWTLHTDGRVRGWGYSESQSYPDIVAISAGGQVTTHYVLLLTSNGLMFSSAPSFYGDDRPYILNNLSNVIAVSASAGSHAAVLANNGAPFAAGRVLDREVPACSTVVLPSGIVGAAPIRFQWQQDGVDIEHATNSLLVLTNVSLSAAGSYRCIAENSLGAVTNKAAKLTVLRSTPRFNISQASPGAGVVLNLDRLSGHGPVVLEASTDLLNWWPVRTNPPVTGSLQIVEPQSLEGRVFYRAVER